MKVIKISNHLFDVFMFDGWEQWSRWTKDKTGFMKQIGGAPVAGFIKANIIKGLSDLKGLS